jgi:hypothetical protein
LTWALIDERISENEKSWLDSALCRSEEARRTYLHCIQLHADLAAHFASREPEAAAIPGAKSPVLRLLGEGHPSTPSPGAAIQ